MENKEFVGVNLGKIVFFTSCLVTKSPDKLTTYNVGKFLHKYLKQSGRWTMRILWGGGGGNCVLVCEVSDQFFSLSI